MSRRLLLTTLILTLAVACPATVVAQKSTTPTRHSSLPSSDFDFMIGEWDLVLTNVPNAPGPLKGRWTAEKSGDGFLVTDEYRIFSPDGETVYLGETYRAYNVSKKQWEIRFVQPITGEWQEGVGKREGSEMHLTQNIRHATGQQYWLRFRYFNIGPDHFSWTSERSEDDGKTWKPGVSLEAKRVHRETSADQRKMIVAIVKGIQQFDYEGNRGALNMLYRQLDPYSVDPELVAAVRYWRGFALWRRAINGFNEKPLPGDLEQDLTQAANEFAEAQKADPNFVDAMIGEAGSLGYVWFMHRNDAEQPNSRLFHLVALMQAAKKLDPDNPRLLWVMGPGYWNRSPEQGGGEEKAMEVYRRGLSSARDRRSKRTDPLKPTWGEPELLMNLAWSSLNRNQPDLKAAEEYATAALALVPNWHYMREILMPQIREAVAKSAMPIRPK